MTEDLRAFIEARLAEDEALARDALHPDAVTPGEWMTEHHNAESNAEPNCCHIAEDRSGNYWTREDLANVGALLTMVRVVKLLAAAWCDHPDYLVEWAPA